MGSLRIDIVERVYGAVMIFSCVNFLKYFDFNLLSPSYCCAETGQLKKFYLGFLISVDWFLAARRFMVNYLTRYHHGMYYLEHKQTK